MKTDHWSKKTIDFILPHFEQAMLSVQIATGFFTIQGYDLVRQALSGKVVKILVGFDERSRERLRQKLIEDIMLYLSRWDVGNRREAVIHLVRKIQGGQFFLTEKKEGVNQLFEARTRSRDHAKVFIIDRKKVVVGSINLTLGGLLYNSEGGTIIEKPERTKFYVERFEEYWNDQNTFDLTEALLKALLAWLELANPFDIYLKTILALVQEEEVDLPRESYKMPVDYQNVVIARVLRQLRTYRGAMLVASTGLGKTVMGTHTALLLNRESRVLNYLVFAPTQVHPDWKRSFKSAGLNCEIFTRELLDRKLTRTGKKSRELMEALDQIDGRYLIIIDESQYFRNKLRAIDGRRRASFQQLMSVIAEKEPLVLLLTATPFSKEIGDLNNQLLLLPHTAEKKYMKPNGQFVFPGMMDDEIAPEAWKVPEIPESYFEKFLELPVSTVISTSQVAKDFAVSTPQGEYLEFGEQKRWIPRIGIAKVKVPVLLEEEMKEALKKQAFRHKRKRFKVRDTWNVSTKTIEKEAEVAWLSSPAALKEVVSKTLNDGYQVEFSVPTKKREEVLGPLSERLETLEIEKDPKFIQLVFFLKKFMEEKRKVILFTERLSTAVYLEKALYQKLPFLKVANTVKETKKGPILKNFDKEVLKLIKGFAPIANRDNISSREKISNYDLFISTDAYSTGVNLQDASVVINYDLAWTPDVIIQRAGRILRFWENPRRVDFIVFVGSFETNHLFFEQSLIVEKRLDRLTNRSQHAQKFSEIPIIPQKDTENFESLSALSSITIEYLGVADPSQIEEFSGVSPFLRHITTLQEHEAYAKAIPNDITSAMVYLGQRELMYLLLEYSNEQITILYDPKKEKIESPKEDYLLNLIKCNPSTPVAEVDPSQIEKLAQKAKKSWMEKKEITNEQAVSRVCALYLIPQKAKPSIEKILEKN